MPSGVGRQSLAPGDQGNEGKARDGSAEAERVVQRVGAAHIGKERLPEGAPQGEKVVIDIHRTGSVAAPNLDLLPVHVSREEEKGCQRQGQSSTCGLVQQQGAAIAARGQQHKGVGEQERGEYDGCEVTRQRQCGSSKGADRDSPHIRAP